MSEQTDVCAYWDCTRRGDHWVGDSNKGADSYVCDEHLQHTAENESGTVLYRSLEDLERERLRVRAAQDDTHERRDSEEVCAAGATSLRTLGGRGCCPPSPGAEAVEELDFVSVGHASKSTSHTGFLTGADDAGAGLA